MLTVAKSAVGDDNLKHTSKFDVMDNELFRFGSFKSFPANSVMRPIRLARAGFFYAGSREEVICFCCGVRNDSWTEDESLLEVHRRLSPHCKYVCEDSEQGKSAESNHDERDRDSLNENSEDERNMYARSISTQNASVGNVTVDHRGINQENDMTTKSVSHTNGQIEVYPGIRDCRPKNYEYALFSERLGSFHDWPARHVVDPHVLARAGFYSTGIQDCVRCFFCSGGIKDFEAGDNPWVEHAKWFPDCAYLRLCKGEMFVNICNFSYNSDLVTLYDNESQMDQENCPEDWLIEIINSAAAKIVLSRGYKQEDVEKGIVFARQKYGQIDIKAQFIMEYLIEVNKQCPGQLIPVSEKHTMSEAAKRKPQNALKNAKETDNSREKRKLEEENRKLKDLITCKICLDNDACVAFLPCGHLASCVECSKSLRKCAVCRSIVQGTVRVYQA